MIIRENLQLKTDKPIYYRLGTYGDRLQDDLNWSADGSVTTSFKNGNSEVNISIVDNKVAKYIFTSPYKIGTPELTSKQGVVTPATIKVFNVGDIIEGTFNTNTGGVYNPNPAKWIEVKINGQVYPIPFNFVKEYTGTENANNTSTQSVGKFSAKETFTAFPFSTTEKKDDKVIKQGDIIEVIKNGDNFLTNDGFVVDMSKLKSVNDLSIENKNLQNAISTMKEANSDKILGLSKKNFYMGLFVVVGLIVVNRIIK